MIHCKKYDGSMIKCMVLVSVNDKQIAKMISSTKLSKFDFQKMGLDDMYLVLTDLHFECKNLKSYFLRPEQS